MTPIIVKWISPGRSAVYGNTDGHLVVYPNSEPDMVAFELGLKFAGFTILEVVFDISDPVFCFSREVRDMLINGQINLDIFSYIERRNLSNALIVEASFKYCVAGPHAVAFERGLVEKSNHSTSSIQLQHNLVDSIHNIPHPFAFVEMEKEGDLILSATLNYVRDMLRDVTVALYIPPDQN